MEIIMSILKGQNILTIMKSKNTSKNEK